MNLVLKWEKRGRFVGLLSVSRLSVLHHNLRICKISFWNSSDFWQTLNMFGIDWMFKTLVLVFIVGLAHWSTSQAAKRSVLEICSCEGRKCVDSQRHRNEQKKIRVLCWTYTTSKPNNRRYRSFQSCQWI